MHVALLALACVACQIYGSRVHTLRKLPHRGDSLAIFMWPSSRRRVEASNALKELALFLLAFNPSALTSPARLQDINPGSRAQAQLDKSSSVMVSAWGGGADFWNERYSKNPEIFEWLEDYSDLRDILEELTEGSREVRILNVGCGNSVLPEEMYDDGYHNIVNIDSSEVVISQMQQRNLNRPDMTWCVMNAMGMTFENDSFDLVIDKGTLDAFSCMKGHKLTIAVYLKEVVRVLRPGGMYFCNSLGEPPTRLKHFEMPHLEWTARETELAQNSVIGNDPDLETYAYIYQVTSSEGKNDRLMPKLIEVHKQLAPPNPVCKTAFREFTPTTSWSIPEAL